MYNFIENLISTKTKYFNLLEGNEAQTRWLLIDPFITDFWGYSREDIVVEYSVDKEERVNMYDKLDYSIIVDNKPKILIEAKSLGTNLYSKFSQISNYFSNIHTTAIYNKKDLIAILTDGDLYLFYTDSIEQGILDKKPYFTIRLSTTEEEDILKLYTYSKKNILEKYKFIIEEPIENYTNEENSYDLEEYYRIDEIEQVFNYYESRSIELVIDNVQIRGKYKSITSFRTLYRELLKEINKVESNLIYHLTIQETGSSIQGSVIDCTFNLTELQDSIKIKTNQGLVYASLSKTRKGMVDRIVYLLQNSSIGLFNVSVRLKQK